MQKKIAFTDSEYQKSLEELEDEIGKLKTHIEEEETQRVLEFLVKRDWGLNHESFQNDI